MNYYHPLKRKKIKTEKENVLEKVVKSKYDTYNDLDKLLHRAEKYLDSDMIKKHFSFNTLGDMLNYLFKEKSFYKNSVKVSLIKSGLKEVKNEIKQMPRMEITEKRQLIINDLRLF